MNKKSLIIIIIELVLLIILYFFVKSKYIELIPECWVYKNTGILCPACGGTRCVQNFLQGNFIEAFFSHMIFFIGIIYLGIIDIVYLINLNRKEKIGIEFYPKYWYAIIFAIVLIIYTIVRNVL